jgi:choline dehydrogenase-like flavoprotein
VTVLTREDLRADQVIGCDVCIVGSGAGGATVAAELAEAGLDVVVLEEGRYFATSDFTADAAAATRNLYRGGGATAAIGSPPVLYQEGRAVGGSTVINGGMSWRTPEAILDRWRTDDGLEHIDAESMAPYFERVERRIHVAHQDPESIGRDQHILKRGADLKGWKVLANLRNQVHCPGSNNCAFGCPTGAKQSALVSYIPRALHFGARIYADVRAERISRDGKRARGVIARVVEADGSDGATIDVRAGLVIAACGAIHTPALLARSGFRSPSGMLGKNLSLHPNVKVVAIFDEDVRGWEGVHQAFQVREFQDRGLVFAAINLPPSVLGMTLPYYGAELGELMSQYSNMMVAGMLCEDTSTGQLRMVGGRPLPTYQLSDHDAANLVDGTRLLCDMLFSAGAKRILLPFAEPEELRSADDLALLERHPVRKESMEVVTVHLMGTARMGADRDRAVCDSWGLVHDASALMVADASLFPSPIGVNPMVTIQALATRNAHYLIENRKKLMS